MVVARHIVVTVPTAATAVPLIASSAARTGLVVGAMVQAHTGTIYLGKSTVSATDYGLKLTTSVAPLLLPNVGEPFDLGTVYICANADNDKLAVTYFEKVSR